MEHVAWVKQLCTAITFLHQHRIAHLGVEPDNIVLDRDGPLTLVDYSTARFIDENSPLIDSAVGTIGWIAPEVERRFGELEKARYCPFRADIWAMGHVLVWKIAVTDPENTWPQMQAGEVDDGGKTKGFERDARED